MSTVNIRTLFPFLRVKISEIRSSDNGQLTLVKVQPDKRFKPVCSGCGGQVDQVHSTSTRVLKDLPMAGSMVLIYYTCRIVKCPTCSFKIEKHDFVQPHSRVTNRMGTYIHELCQHMTVSAVSRHTGLSWDQVKRIDKLQLSKKFNKISFENVEVLCVDEISVKKRHNYLTVIADQKTGRVLTVLETRTYESVSLYLKSLSQSVRNQFRAIAMDMWDAYIKAFSECCPNACIVFDPFHVIAAFSRVIDKIRAEQFRKADAAGKALLKKSRFLLLRNPQNLKKEQRPRLKAILENNELLAQVYVLKDYLKRLWKYSYRKSATKFLNYWCSLANETDNILLINFAKMLKNHSYGILNHCKFPISTARLEGINNKIKVIKRTAYGYRDLEYFKFKIIQSSVK